MTPTVFSLLLTPLYNRGFRESNIIAGREGGRLVKVTEEKENEHRDNTGDGEQEGGQHPAYSD